MSETGEFRFGDRGQEAGCAGSGRSVEVEEGAHVGFVGARDGIAFVDEGEEERFAGEGGGRLGEGEEGERGGAEGYAVDAFETWWRRIS